MATLDTASRVLVIEPSKVVRKQLRKVLPGMDLSFAEGATAIGEALRTVPDVILMDAALPGEDGFSIMKRLRLRAETRDVPIVLFADPATVSESGPGAQDVVVSLEDLDALPARLARLVREGLYQKAFRAAFTSTLALIGPGRTGLTRDERSALEGGGFPVDEALDAAPLAEHAARYQAILASSLTTEQAGKRLGVNPSRIRQRLLAHPPELYSIRQGKAWRLPGFQFARRGLVPNIEKVISRLDPGLDPVAVDGWFRRPNVEIEQDGDVVSPLDWLAQGKRWETVAELAGDL